METKGYYKDIKASLKNHDIKNVHRICKEFAALLYSTDDLFDIGYTEKIILELRNHNLFSLLQLISEALILTGRATEEIKFQYCQSFIDQHEIASVFRVSQQQKFDTILRDKVAGNINKQHWGPWRQHKN